MIEDRAAALAGKVEVGVLREVHRRRLVRSGVVIDGELVVVGERVGDGRRQRAGIAFLAVPARVGEHEAYALRAVEGRDRPVHLVEAPDAAVECVGAVVRDERVPHGVEREGRLGDAVAVAADDRAEVRRLFQVAGKVVVAENDVGHGPRPVGDAQRGDDAAVADHAHRDTGGVRERVRRDRVVGWQHTERCGDYAARRRCHWGGGRGVARGRWLTGHGGIPTWVDAVHGDCCRGAKCCAQDHGALGRRNVERWRRRRP